MIRGNKTEKEKEEERMMGLEILAPWLV